MNEAEWLASTDPDRMLDFLLGRSGTGEATLLGWLGLRRRSPSEAAPRPGSTRKLLLYACACCRRIWPLLLDERSRTAVEVSERHADEMASLEELETARAGALQAVEALPADRIDLPLAVTLGIQRGPARAYTWAGRAAAGAVGGGIVDAVVAAVVRAAMEVAVGWHDERWAADAIGAAVREHLLRDIFGNPFQPLTVDRACMAWHDGTVPKIARAIYDEYRFEDLPILADALEDAGCGDEAMLHHCRQPGEHVRGCWVVDALVGKE